MILRRNTSTIALHNVENSTPTSAGSSPFVCGCSLEKKEVETHPETFGLKTIPLKTGHTCATPDRDTRSWLLDAFASKE